MIDYDKTKFFEAVRNLHEYQVGKEYYFMHDGKITKGKVIEVILTITDLEKSMTVRNYLRVDFSVALRHSEHTDVFYPSQLFESREEAAEQFLKDNDVPSELLKVLNPKKSKTTVADLVSKLQEFNPELDLESDFYKLLASVTKRLLPVELNDQFWDCECKERYIHSIEKERCRICGTNRDNALYSRIDEIRPENFNLED